MAFNSDRNVEKEFTKLFKRYGIEQIIETGTYVGDTTRFLASFGVPVHTIEVVPENHRIASNNLSYLNNVKCHLGNSADVLKELPTDKQTIFYLDAHWQDYCPLRDEIKIIREKYPGAVIVIDDFQTPDRNFHFDRFGQDINNFDYIKDSLPKSGTGYYMNRTEREAFGVGKFYWVPDGGSGLYFTADNGHRYSVV